MAKEKEYNKKSLVTPEQEIPTHKKKSNDASTSSTKKRSDHKHDYERVIIQKSFQQDGYFWGKRCTICGRVDDSDLFKATATKGLVKKIEKVKLNGEVFNIKVFYSESDLKKLFPEVSILCYDFKTREYVEIVGKNLYYEDIE